MKLFVSLFPLAFATLCSASKQNIRRLPPQDPGNTQLSILSRNLYLGSDGNVLFDTNNFGRDIHDVIQDFFDEALGTNFELRSAALAKEILDRQPDVVCLQEVFTTGLSDFEDGSQVYEELD